jgi:hypothetical protein
MISRYGSHALAVGLRLGRVGAEPVITSMAGFELSSAGFVGAEPVITSMAGFAGPWPQRPDGPIEIPAALRYPLAVSRRTPVVAWMRLRLHPRRPSTSTCCCLSSLKTLPIPAKDHSALRLVNVPARYLIWPVLR